MRLDDQERDQLVDLLHTDAAHDRPAAEQAIRKMLADDTVVDPAVVEWLKQLLGSVAYRNETNRGPAIAMLDGLLTAREDMP